MKVAKTSFSWARGGTPCVPPAASSEHVLETGTGRVGSGAEGWVVAARQEAEVEILLGDTSLPPGPTPGCPRWVVLVLLPCTTARYRPAAFPERSDREASSCGSV